MQFCVMHVYASIMIDVNFFPSIYRRTANAIVILRPHQALLECQLLHEFLWQLMCILQCLNLFPAMYLFLKPLLTFHLCVLPVLLALLILSLLYFLLLSPLLDLYLCPLLSSINIFVLHLLQILLLVLTVIIVQRPFQFPLLSLLRNWLLNLLLNLALNQLLNMYP